MQHRYFASSNSSEGFKSYYAEVFERADRVYVIKGGPGTGKSGFMRKCATAAEKAGREVEYYFCSSDPSSIDGVLISGKGGGIGIVDGTAPHTWEPSQPGAREEIINFGSFWRSELLRGQKNEIFSLSNKKSAAYKRAYSYLRSCGNLRAVTDSLLRKATDFEKLQSAAVRLARSLSLKDGELTVIPALTGAVGMTGVKRLDTIEKNSEKLWQIGEFYGVGQWFMDALLGALKRYHGLARVSYDCVVPRLCDGIFIENEALGFALRRKGDESVPLCDDKYINPKRFIHTEKMREIRGELRYAARLYDECLDGALHALGEAKIYHFLLEDIYKNAMDFGALGEFSQSFAKEILQ